MDNKKQKLVIIIIAAVFFISAAVSAYMLLSDKCDTVEIISGGKVLYTIDISREPDREIVVEYKGRKNVIAIKDHEIYMKEAECPDHTCIKTGKLSKSGVPIVCLPNKLIIKYSDNGSEGDVDAAA